MLCDLQPSAGPGRIPAPVVPGGKSGLWEHTSNRDLARFGESAWVLRFLRDGWPHRERRVRRTSRLLGLVAVALGVGCGQSTQTMATANFSGAITAAWSVTFQGTFWPLTPQSQVSFSIKNAVESSYPSFDCVIILGGLGSQMEAGTFTNATSNPSSCSIVETAGDLPSWGWGLPTTPQMAGSFTLIISSAGSSATEFYGLVDGPYLTVWDYPHGTFAAALPPAGTSTSTSVVTVNVVF